MFVIVILWVLWALQVVVDKGLVELRGVRPGVVFLLPGLGQFISLLVFGPVFGALGEPFLELPDSHKELILSLSI